MSNAATDPFKVYASVPMLPGTSVPAMGDLAAGAPLVKPADKANAPLSPAQALGAYAVGLNYPKPVASKAVATTDAYATALRASTAAQVKSLGTLAYFTGISDGGGFGEVLFMIAIMVALQAQIMWRRAQVLLPASAPVVQPA